MKRAALLLLIGGALGCPPASTLPKGCGKDVDCKGVRICVAHACVDPQPKKPPVVPAADLGPPASDGGISDGGAADLAVVELPKPLGASQMFHVDAMHAGRSRFKFPTAAPKETMHVATGAQSADLNPRHWADESLALAKSDVYHTPIGAGAGPFTVNSAYRQNAQKIAAARVTLAAARLAGILNAELK